MTKIAKTVRSLFVRKGGSELAFDATRAGETRRFKKRWRILSGVLVLLLLLAAAPILWIETSCGTPSGRGETTGYSPRLGTSDRRNEVRTWLTYPEWHIVYSAESLGRHLSTGKPPSSYAYGRDVGAFWGSLCRLNRVAADQAGTGDAKIMLYTIGLSFSAEMAIKATYENTLGRLFEALVGWQSQDDAYSAKVQSDYAAFMHEVPWYQFDFSGALAGLWQTESGDAAVRHWERRFALSLEYGVKALYAKLIGWASGQALGEDETRLRMLVKVGEQELQAADSTVEFLGKNGEALLVDVPRYGRFTALIEKLAATDTELVEIAGNDDILVTFLAPQDNVTAIGSGPRLVNMALGDRKGWRRVGVAVKVTSLLPTIRAAKERGAELEHIYDY